MEFVLFGLFLAGEGWCRSGKSSFPKWTGLSNFAAALFLAGGVISFATLDWPAPPSTEEIRMKQSVLHFYKNGEMHFALDRDLPLMAGKRIWYEPLTAMMVWRAGFWDIAPLLEDIRRKRFATIELYDVPVQYLCPDQVSREVLRNYRVQMKAYGRIWYVPNPK